MRFKPSGAWRAVTPHHLGLVGWALLLAAVIAVAPFVIWFVTRVAMLLRLVA